MRAVFTYSDLGPVRLPLELLLYLAPERLPCVSGLGLVSPLPIDACGRARAAEVRRYRSARTCDGSVGRDEGDFKEDIRCCLCLETAALPPQSVTSYSQPRQPQVTSYRIVFPSHNDPKRTPYTPPTTRGYCSTLRLDTQTGRSPSSATI